MSGTDESIFLGDTIEKNYDPNVIMKRGEAFFEKEEYAEAIVEYNHFLDLHRNHTLASYAAFRIGESQMKRAKGIDRDPEPIQKAIDSFERLRRDYPGSRYDGQAMEKTQECHDMLAQMHLFVGPILLSTAILSGRGPSIRTDYETLSRQVRRAGCPVFLSTQLPRSRSRRLGQ